MHRNNRLKSWFDQRTQKSEESAKNSNKIGLLCRHITDKLWYELLYPFLDKIISIYYDLGIVGHIIERETQFSKSDDVLIWGETL